jgi:PAS domain S-box-containing protein
MAGQSQLNQKCTEAHLEALNKRLREATFLYETGRVLTATLDHDSVLESLMTQVRDYFQVEAASAALWDEESDELIFTAVVGTASEKLIGFRVAADYGVAGYVLRTGKIVVTSEAEADDRWYSGVDAKTGFHTRAMLAVPIVYQERTIGVIEALNPPDGVFSDDARELLPAVADVAAIAIRNAELYERTLQAEAQYENLFNASLDAVVVLDLDGRVINLNTQASQLFQCPHSQLIGTDFWTLAGIPRSVAADVIQALDENSYYGMESEYISAGQSRTLEAHFSKVSYGTHDAIQWVGHDISERLALERMREDMTNMIVHDLRNPLGSIISSLQLIRTAIVEHDTTLPIPHLLSIGLLSGHKMHRLIDSLLDAGRLTAGETELKKTWASPAALITEAVDQMQALVLNKRQELSVQDMTNLPDLYVEYDMIVRVLTNLLDNAIKFTPKAGHISVCAEQRHDVIQFTISDTGPGVPPADRIRIFERFARLDNATRTKGSGLGLAFCKLAVEAHEGRIWVESEPEGGSNFHFTLPVMTT